MSKLEAKPTINQKIDQLNQSVEWFYGEDFALEKAEEHYKNTIKLAKEIEKDLNEIKNDIKIIAEDFTKS